MDIEDIKKLVDGKTEDLIAEAAKRGIDFSDLSPDIARKMVSGYFGLTEKDFLAVDFVFWVAYFLERSAEDLIIEPEVKVGAREKAVELLVKELHFGGKIKIIEELHLSKHDALVKIMRKIQNYRNDIAHGRFNNLIYKNYHLSDNRGKLLLVADLRDIFLKKGV